MPGNVATFATCSGERVPGQVADQLTGGIHDPWHAHLRRFGLPNR